MWASKAPERRHLNIVQNVETSQQGKLPTYKKINELKTRIENLKIFQKGWIISNGQISYVWNFPENPISHLNLKDESLWLAAARRPYIIQNV